MQEEVVDVLGLQARIHYCLVQHTWHVPCRKLVYLLSDHRDGCIPTLANCLASNLLLLSSEGQLEVAIAVPITVQLEAQKPRLLHRLRGREDHRPSAIAEEHARVAILPIDPPREGIGTHNQSVLGGASVQELPRRHDPKQEPRARRRQVHRKRVLGADGRGHGGGVAEHVLGRARRHDHHVDVLSLEARRRERTLCRTDRQVPHSLRAVQDVAALNARPRADPFLGGVHNGLHVFVGHPVCRHRVSDPYRFALERSPPWSGRLGLNRSFWLAD
mmetsp:Transcript_45597/g.110968  ORF Transcript_45597/g.110968 Transcript_45597/m.110968 type:complete len:274 (-) Transcript_45597:223-1044(-)